MSKDKIIISDYKGKTLTLSLKDGKAYEIDISNEEKSIIGNIYIAKVKNIVKNINSAFVELDAGDLAYYGLNENKSHIFTDGKKHDKLVEGDEIVVQIVKEAIKTKAPIASSHLSIPGRYAVIEYGKPTIKYSSKIKDIEWKKNLSEKLEEILPADLSLIIRTNAYMASEEDIISDIRYLIVKLSQVINNMSYRTFPKILLNSDPYYIKLLLDKSLNTDEEILTDNAEYYQEIKSILNNFHMDMSRKLRLYDDKLLPLSKLYSVDTIIDNATNRRVWLKSGAYLVIDYTEAMTVIDVNTGKTAIKKNAVETIRKTNLEAAKEILNQLRLRNISGIIIVDFIDMENKSTQDELLDFLRDEVKSDVVATSIVDITKLNLVEITRKKIRKPLHEQIYS